MYSLIHKLFLSFCIKIVTVIVTNIINAQFKFTSVSELPASYKATSQIANNGYNPPICPSKE